MATKYRYKQGANCDEFAAKLVKIRLNLIVGAGSLN
jgi:hypothetical protein